MHETNYYNILKDMIMKRILLALLMAFITATAFAQICPISVTVKSIDESTGIITFDYEFTGFEGRTHKITTIEVDFDDDEGYQQIPEEYLSGDYPEVVGPGPTFSGTIEWDAAASFPNRFQEQTKIRVKAEQHYISGDGVTDIDSNFYSTVIIGNQEWMAENLRVTKYNNGNDIPTGLSNAAWGSTTGGAYAIYPHGDIAGLNSDEEVLEAYGALYNWYAVTDSRGLCPEGWSVPSHDDWTQLEQYICNALGNSDCETQFPYDNTTTDWRGTNEGNALKSCLQGSSPLECCDTSLHPRWDSDGTHYGFDEFGFSALPGGYRNSGGSYINIGIVSAWWSSTGSSTTAWLRVKGSNHGNVRRHNFSAKTYGDTIRCFRDNVRTEDE
jgi:uncharacterized protein (TIGR02145 family)